MLFIARQAIKAKSAHRGLAGAPYGERRIALRLSAACADRVASSVIVNIYAWCRAHQAYLPCAEAYNDAFFRSVSAVRSTARV